MQERISKITARAPLGSCMGRLKEGCPQNFPFILADTCI